MRCAAVLVAALLIAAPASARTMYISEVMKITLRTGMGTDHKIIAMIESGDRVDLITPGEDWSFVRLPDGREGWILSRFLTPNPPSAKRLKSLSAAYEKSKAAAARASAENKTLSAENERLTKTLAETEQKLAEISAAHEQLKTDSAEYFAIKKKHDELAAMVKTRSAEVDSLTRSVERLRFNRNLKWFGAGAAVLLFGIILGTAFRGRRRMSPLDSRFRQ